MRSSQSGPPTPEQPFWAPPVVVLVAALSLVVASCGDGETEVEIGDATTTDSTSRPAPNATASTEPSTTLMVTTEVPGPTSGVTSTSTGTTAVPLPGAWREMAASPLGARTSPVSAWTGTELLVWAGIPETSDECAMDEGGGPLCGEPAVFDGGAYDPTTDTWRTIASGPVPAGGAPTQIIPRAAWTGSELVVWGGWGDPIAAAYDPAKDRWRDLPPGPLDTRDQQAVVVWGDRVAVLGGQTPFGPGSPEPRLDGALLDPATGEWTPLPDLPSGDPMMAPGLVTATEADGRLFVVSLVNPQAHVLDRDGTEWRSLGSAGVEGFLEPVGVAGGRWLFVGGRSDGTDTGVAVVLDLSSGQWSEIAAPTTSTTRYVGAGTGDKVLAVAERFFTETDPPSAWSWDPATDTWIELAPPPLEHRVGAGIAWTGTELLVWGGGNTGGFGGPSFADGAAYHP